MIYEKNLEQNNYGHGDNIGGNKIVTESISPITLKSSLKDILEKIRHRQFTEANQHIYTLQETTSLNSDSIETLKIIEISIKLLTEAPSVNKDKNTLLNYLTQNPASFLQDIALSILLQLESKSDKLTEANQRFDSTENPGTLTKEAYFEFVTTPEAINTYFEENKLSLTEGELCGMIRGLLRSSCSKEALRISNHLNELVNNSNSKLLVLYSKIEIFNNLNPNIHYWKLTANSRKDLLSICDEVIEHIKDNDETDSRLIDAIASIFDFTYAELESISDICWEYIHKLEEKHPATAQRVRSLYDRQAKYFDTINAKINKAHNDSSYKHTIITELTTSPDITPEDSFLLSMISDKKSINNWLSNGGQISAQNDLIRDFSYLKLRTIACHSNPKSVIELKKIVKQFTEKHTSKIINIFPLQILEIAKTLINLQLTNIACQFIEPHLPKTDFWASPLFLCYLDALYQGQQTSTLESTLQHIKSEEWNDYIWAVKAQYLSDLHKYDDAIIAIEEAISLSPRTPFNWLILLNSHNKSGSSKIILKKLIDRIPQEIFTEPDTIKLQLLYEIARLSSFTLAEYYLTDWFIKDPNGFSIQFTDFHHSFFLNEKREQLEHSSEIGLCYKGVKYSCEGTIITQIIVADESNTHQALIKKSSPLGLLLLDMENKEIRHQNVQEIRLIDTLTPYVACYNIALQIRQSINDGSDCFYSFNVPSEPSELINTIEKKLKLILQQDEKSTDLNPKIPILMKGFFDNRSAPVNAALNQLTSKKTVKLPLPAFGNEQPDQAILDIYSICYLAITNLTDIFLKSEITPIITVETKNYIEDWLADITRKDYLTIGLNQKGRLYRQTAKDVTRDTIKIQVSFKAIILHSQVVTPCASDLPTKLAELPDCVDLSVMSSIKLSIANNIEWLCVDLLFAQYHEVFNYKVVNASSLLPRLSNQLSIEEKFSGIAQFIFGGLPFPIEYTDLVLLSKSSYVYSNIYLSKLIRMNINGINELRDPIDYLHHISVITLTDPSVFKDLQGGLSIENPQNNGLAERVIYACFEASMNNNVDDKAHRNISILISRLFRTFHHIPDLSKIITNMASHFANGHFLCIQTINQHLKDILTHKK